MTEPDTYRYESGPSVFMSGDSDWIIRRVGKPGIIASIVGRETHAKAAVDALNQAAKHAAFADANLRKNADALAAALHVAIYDMHPAYGSTAGWRGGIGGSAITQGCSFNDTPTYMRAMPDRLRGTLRTYIDRYGPDLGAAHLELLSEPGGQE